MAGCVRSRNSALGRKRRVPDIDDEPVALGYADAAAHREALDPVASGVFRLLPVIVIPGHGAIEILPLEEVTS
jgi:hypothetical protein